MTIDLSLLPPPDVIETIDYEVILTARKTRMRALLDEAGVLPDWDQDSESDPIVKMLEENAFREVLLRQRVNDGARAVMLATSNGADLENIVARYGVERQLITPADPEALPPVEAVYETDARLLLRGQLAYEGLSVAGPRGAYRFHALSADPRVKDVGVSRPEPGTVLVTILSTEGDGTAPADLLDIVSAALNDEDVRPLNDTVVVQSAEILHYMIAATLYLSDGPDTSTVEAASLAAARAYADARHRVGALVALSGIDGALHQTGVIRAIRTEPAAEIVPNATQAAYCDGITIEIGGDDGE